MANLVASFNVVLPLFLLMIVGCFFKRRGIISASTIPSINRLTHLLFLPALLFKNVISCDLKSGLPWKIVLIAAVSSTVSFAISLFLSRKI